MTHPSYQIILTLLLLAAAVTTPVSAISLSASLTVQEEISNLDLGSAPDLAGLTARLPDLLSAERHSDIGEQSYSSLAYSMADPDPYVSVDSNSGQMKLHTKIDLEQLCQASFACLPDKGRHEFTVLVRTYEPGGRRTRPIPIARLRFTLNVTDVNDHSPKFPIDSSRQYFDIVRDESICFVVPNPCSSRKISLPGATDADYSSEFNSISYILDPTSVSRETANNFALKTDEIGNPYLLILEGLDAEKRQFYQFDLLARDRPGREDRIRIRLTIKDVNDNSPRFRERFVNVSVPENQPNGTLIMKFIAEDKDLQHNLIYSLDPTDTSDVSRRHLFVSTDGRLLTTAVPLDYEATREFRFTVRVFDGDFTDKATVLLRVLDRNDNPPRYRESADLQTSVAENKQPGQTLGVVAVSDPDTGLGGQWTCRDEAIDGRAALRIENAASAGMPGIFNIVLQRSLDREVEPNAMGILICWDAGDPSLTSTYTALVEVTDINDNAPVFTNANRWGRIEAQVEENRHPGALVANLRATDADKGENARVTFRIVSKSALPFAIDSESGRLSTTRLLDRESVDKYELLVEAADAGKPSLSTTATVQVSVLDTNDHAPDFFGARHFSVLENGVAPLQLGRLKARDADLGENGRVTFTLLSSPTASSFRLDQDGSLYGLVSFDREKYPEHRLRVRASDQGPGGLARHSDTEVVVQIVDMDDEPPRIVSPAENGTVVRISIYTHPENALVVRVRAVDPDVGENARMVYKLTSPETFPPRFRIDPSNGDVRVAQELGIVDLRRHTVVARVVGNGLRDDWGDVRLIYIDVDNSLPIASDDSASSLTERHTRRNVVIIITLASVSALLAVALILAVACINRSCTGGLFDLAYRAGRSGGSGAGSGAGGQSKDADDEEDQRYCEQETPLTEASCDIGSQHSHLCHTLGCGRPFIVQDVATLYKQRHGAVPSSVNPTVSSASSGVATSADIGCATATSADGNRSDSGRGCSDEDLSCALCPSTTATASGSRQSTLQAMHPLLHHHHHHLHHHLQQQLQLQNQLAASPSPMSALPESIELGVGSGAGSSLTMPSPQPADRSCLAPRVVYPEGSV